MESEDKERLKAGEKRTRDLVSSLSSVSEADSSITEVKTVIQKKKAKGNQDQTMAENETNEIDIAIELKNINMKLNNVLTKDSTELKDLIKNINVQLKEEMLGSVITRIEKIESDLFEKEEENIRMTKQIDKIKQELDEQKNETEILRKQLKLQETSNELKLNEIEQYSRRSNIKIEVIPDSDHENMENSAEKSSEP